MDKILLNIQALSSNDGDLRTLLGKLRGSEGKVPERDLLRIDESLQQLHPRAYSLGFSYLLSQKISHIKDHHLFIQQARELVRLADPAQIRHYPPFLCAVCRQLVTSALLCQRPAQAVQTLLNAAQLLQFGRAALLTPVHTDLLQTCLKAKVYHVAERVADAQLYELAPLDNGLTAQDYLAFHYYAAIAYVAAKKFERALECLQLVLTAPSSALSQVQIAAYGKYVLCCFIVHGRAVDLPSRITSSVVLRLLPKLCEVYEQLAVQQRKGVEPLRAALDEHKAALAQDGNFGLAKQAVAALVRRNIQRLTNTYTTLALRDIAEQNKLPGGAAEAERLVLQMIEEGALAATVDQRDGSVTFHTDVERYSSSRMAERLHLQVRELQQLSRKLKQEEEEIVTSRDYLAKTLRAGTMSAARGGGGGGGGGGQGGFDEPL